MPPSFRAAKDLGMLAILMITKRNHSEFLPLRNVQKSLLTFELVQFRMLNVYEWDIGHKNIRGSLSHMCNKHMVKMETERVYVRSASHGHCDSEAFTPSAA